MIRSELASRLVAIHGPEWNEDTGSALLGWRKAEFSKLRFTQQAPVSPLPDDINADAAAFGEVMEVLGQQLWHGV
jgi:hypothetical protein